MMQSFKNKSQNFMVLAFLKTLFFRFLQIIKKIGHGYQAAE